MGLRPLDIILRTIDQATGPIRQVQRLTRQTARMFRSAGRSATTGLTLPILGVGVAAGRITADLDTSMSRIRGLVGVNADQVAKWREEILKLGPATGRGPRELADALFFISSAGLRGQTAIDLLTISAKAAAAGLGDTKVVSDAASSAMNAYGAENLSAERAVSLLFLAVRKGKTDAESLAPVVGRVIPIAAELGVEFEQVAGAMAAMTVVGASAEESATALRATLAGLLNPGQDAKKALASVGLSAEGLREQIDREGLLDVLLTLRERFDGNTTALARVFPNIRALTGVLNLVGKNAETAGQIFDEVANTGVEALNSAFRDFINTAGGKFSVAASQIGVLLIRLGDAILPVLLPILEDVTRAIEAAAGWFSALSPGVKTTIVVIAGLVAVVGPLLIVFGAIAGAISALLPIVAAVGVGISAVVGGLGAIVVGLIAVGTWAFNTFEPFRDLVLYVWEVLQDIFGLFARFGSTALGAFGPIGQLTQLAFNAFGDGGSARVDAATLPLDARIQNQEVSATVRVEATEGSRISSVDSDDMDIEVGPTMVTP